MFFYLTNSLIVSEDSPSFTNIYKAIQNIAIQAVNGIHSLTGSFEIIEHCRFLFQGNPILGSLFNNIYQNYAFAGIPCFLNFYIEVVTDNPTKRNENGKEIQQIIYSQLENTGDWTVKLICEDLNDTIFYKHIMKWYINKLPNGNHVFSACHGISGGGCNTYKTVNNELNDHQISICIVDTDKKYEGCLPEKDGTYEKCVKNIVAPPSYYKFIAIPVHEIENLIPLNYIDAFDIWSNGKKDDKENKRDFDYLRLDSEHILPYFDYKKGIKKDDMFDNCLEYREFAHRCYNTNLDFMSRNPDFEAFVNSVPSKGKIYPHLLGGSGILNRTIDLINGDNLPEPSLLGFQEKEWNKIGQAMLDWCIAKGPESII